MKWALVLTMISAAAFAEDDARVSSARDLAHGHSIHDQVLIGNALVRLKQAACLGDSRAAALLGRKYISGKDEFQPNYAKAEPYLLYAAEKGEGDAALDLVLLNVAKPASTESIETATMWLQVAFYLNGFDSPQARVVQSSLQILTKNNPDLPASPAKVQTSAALTIHRIRNALNAKVSPPCNAD